MDDITRENLTNLRSDDLLIQRAAFFAVIEATDQPVDCAYEVWDDFVDMLKLKNNHRRAIAALVLCNLVKSEPEQRMQRDFDAMLHVTKDTRFVTARHSLQALWKVGAAGKLQQQQVVDALARRFHQCTTEKNGTLFRYDIVDNLRKLYDAVQDESIRRIALALIETEENPKYRQKYAGLWKGK